MWEKIKAREMANEVAWQNEIIAVVKATEAALIGCREALTSAFAILSDYDSTTLTSLHFSADEKTELADAKKLIKTLLDFLKKEGV